MISSITGQKFPHKSLEVSLQATVHFYDNAVASDTDDAFCTGLNAYIDVSQPDLWHLELDIMTFHTHTHTVVLQGDRLLPEWMQH